MGQPDADLLDQWGGLRERGPGPHSHRAIAHQPVRPRLVECHLPGAREVEAPQANQEDDEDGKERHRAMPSPF